MKPRAFPQTVILFLIFAAWVTAAAGATSKTFVVTSVLGSKDIPNTLTWAIYQANYQGGDINHINFNIPGVTAETEITLTETLYLARPTIIDGTTQPGYAGQPLIRINCNRLDSGFIIVGVVAGIPPLSDGSPSTGTGSSIQGFRITNYRSNAVTILKGADSTLIANNQIGFTPLPVPGTYLRNVTLSPLCGGIGIASNSNVIRGNTISGVYNAITMGDNVDNPAAITGTVYKNNSFDHNFIGTNPTGTASIGNDSDGIFFGAGCQQNLIGPGNVLSGMASAGIELLHSTVTDNRIFGNMIGLNAAGTGLIPNGELGILIANGAANNWVGGPYGGIYAGNVISGNGHGAVAIGTTEFPGVDGSNNNHVEGNFIGTDGADTKALGLQVSGVSVQNKSKGTIIRRNVIVGQLNHGVVFSDASNNAIYGNWIGVTDKGAVIPNLAFGVYLFDASDNIVQPSLATAGPGKEQNIFGTNTSGPVGVYGNSLRNVIDLTPPASQLLNVSTRKPVGIGDNVLISGFIVTGTEDKKVILRGLGPSLPVAGALADPTLELHDVTHTLVSNDNWVDSPNKQAIIDSTIPPTNDLESAIVATVAAKPAAQGGAGYTGVLAGKNGSTGIGLIEIYDLATASNSKLANISTRGFVGTGNDVLIGGFIPGPSDRTSSKVLIRGLGPSLAAQNVSGVLLDPVLELHNANGSTIIANDSWRDAPNLAEIVATGIPPTDDREAAIVITLAPSNSGYTALIRGANNTTGVALVEVYDLN